MSVAQHPMTPRQVAPRASLVALLLAGAWLGTFLAGGSHTVAPHLFYLPVLYAALRLRPPFAVAAAVLAGVLAGPLMPLDVAAGTGQPLLNWMARLVAFIVAALAASLLIQRDQRAETRQRAAMSATWEINRRQRDFLTHVHHELRTPVTVVFGTLELIAARGDDLCPADLDRLRDAAYRNAEVLSHLVEDLTGEVDQALPGLALAEDVNGWSSRPRRMRTAEAR